MTAIIREQQEILENFIARDIYANQSSLIEEAFKIHFFSIDDIENMYRPFDGKLLDPSRCYRCFSQFQLLDSEIGACEVCYEETNQPQEIFEWWIVSPWLARKLIIEGQPVLDNDYGLWWGRCTTGQAIILDYVIERIYESLMT